MWYNYELGVIMSDVNRKIKVEREMCPSFQTTIGKLHHDWKNRPRSDYPYAKDFILGQPLPDFQRELCWTLKQQMSFIESIWYGFDIGFYMVAMFETNNPDGSLVKYSDALIDGQQRLFAIQEYWENKFTIFDYTWDELTIVDHRMFTNLGFPHKEIRTLDEQKLKDTYNRLNFAGIQHSIDQKA